MKIEVNIPFAEDEFNTLSDIDKFATIARAVNVNYKLIAKASSKKLIGYDEIEQENGYLNKIILGIEKIKV